jgi:hypothetical protein
LVCLPEASTICGLLVCRGNAIPAQLNQPRAPGNALFAPVAWDDLPVQDHVRESLVSGPFERLAQRRGLLCQHGNDLVQAEGGGPGDAMIAGQGITGNPVAEPAQPQHCLP